MSSLGSAAMLSVRQCRLKSPASKASTLIALKETSETGWSSEMKMQTTQLGREALQDPYGSMVSWF